MLEFVLLAGFAVFAVYITVRSSEGKKEVAAPETNTVPKAPRASFVARWGPGKDPTQSMPSGTAAAL